MTLRPHIAIFKVFQSLRGHIKSVFRVTGLNILGKVGTHVFSDFFNSMHFEMHKVTFFFDIF